MLDLTSYNTFIFDCDGVILDSNQLKISAMGLALAEEGFDSSEVDGCVKYFAENFGKSRFHHVEKFVSDILKLPEAKQKKTEAKILSCYSSKCKGLYIEAQITPGFIDFVANLNGNKFVASGSEQEELREVFGIKNLDRYFDAVYGSPTAKFTLVEKIVNEFSATNCLMFGDALSDLNAAVGNNIDFVAYLPYSNVQHVLHQNTLDNGFTAIYDWSELAIF